MSRVVIGEMNITLNLQRGVKIITIKRIKNTDIKLIIINPTNANLIIKNNTKEMTVSTEL